MTPRTARTRSTSSPSRPPSLSLRRRKRRARLLGAAGHVVGVAEPHRPRRRRPGARQPEQPPDGLRRAACPGGRGARRRARPAPRLAGRRQPRVDLLERERIVPEQRRVLLDVRQRGCRRLVVARRSAPPRRSRRSRRAAARPGRPRPCPRLARDDERLGEPQRHDPGVELHARKLQGSGGREEDDFEQLAGASRRLGQDVGRRPAKGASARAATTPAARQAAPRATASRSATAGSEAARGATGQAGNAGTGRRPVPTSAAAATSFHHPATASATGHPPVVDDDAQRPEAARIPLAEAGRGVAAGGGEDGPGVTPRDEGQCGAADVDEVVDPQ